MRWPFAHARNVLAGELPKFAPFTFMNIVERARRLLVDCDLESSTDRLNELGWFPVSIDPDRYMPGDSGEPRLVEPHQQDATEPSLVYQNMHEFTEDELNGFSWSQYFCLLALNCVSQAWLYELLANSAEFKESEFMRYLPNALASFAAEAAEAVCLGEQLQQKEQEIEQAVRKQISERSSKAAKRRRPRVAQLKREFIDYYETGEFPSKAKAVERFISELTDDKQKILVPTNAERTLLEALRSHLRSTADTNNKN